MAAPCEITRHFVATAYVVCQGRVLLHRHRSLGMILPVGGHIERDELPHQAALREALEEAGVEAELIDVPGRDSYPEICGVPQPTALLVEDIHPGHQHIDLVYFARARSARLRPGKDQGSGFRWYTSAELLRVKLEKSVRTLALAAIAAAGRREAAGTADGGKPPV